MLTLCRACRLAVNGEPYETDIGQPYPYLLPQVPLVSVFGATPAGESVPTYERFHGQPLKGDERAKWHYG